MKICILPLRTLSFDEDTVRTLPFGEAERERLCSIRNPSRARSSLGALLALQALIEDKPLPILRSPMGKPYFDAPDAPAFSLSHTDTLAVAALADSGEGSIGIDMEMLRPLSHAARVADRFFTEDERAQWAALPTPTTFFRLWTAKEATAKMCGHGLSAALSEGVPIAAHTKHARLSVDGDEAILCVATEHTATTVSWHTSPLIQIHEDKGAFHV